MKILIVEDEQFSRTMLCGYVKKLGHQVFEAVDGDEAWRILQSEDIPLVITDWVMPGTDGLTLIQKIRTTVHRCYVYIILVTAKTEKRDVVEGIMAGADDFLTKPYDVDELRVRVRAGERIVQLEERLIARNVELEAARKKLEESHDRMKRDLAAAAKIQQSLLPTTVPMRGQVDCAWMFRPCEELAGDIFNVFELDQNHIGFYLLDVSGHGVPAALLSVTLSRLLSPAASSSSVLFSSHASGPLPVSPCELATDLNNRFQMSDSNHQYFTLLFGEVNLESRELRYVSAGHPGPVYVPAEGLPRFLNACGFPIGMEADPGYEDETLVLSPGDQLLVYSDGLVDATNHDGVRFGPEGILQCVTEKRQSLKQIVRLLEDRVLKWCEGHWPDDISVLALRISESSARDVPMN